MGAITSVQLTFASAYHTLVFPHPNILATSTIDPRLRTALRSQIPTFFNSLLLVQSQEEPRLFRPPGFLWLCALQALSAIIASCSCAYMKTNLCIGSAFGRIFFRCPFLLRIYHRSGAPRLAMNNSPQRREVTSSILRLF